MGRALWVIAMLAGCNGTPSSGGGSGSDAKKPSDAGAGGGTIQELTLTERGRVWKVKVVVPRGWTEQVSEGSRHYQGSWMAKFDIGVTCHGSCDTVETATKNIAQQAQERFDFVSSANHIPPLTATWVKKLVEDSPGVWSWRFRAVNDKEKQSEDQFSVDRILPGGDPTSTWILTCNGDIDEREPPGVADLLEKACKDLTYVEVTKP